MTGSPLTELSDCVRSFEAVQNREGWAHLEEFLPAPSHPDYLSVLRELVCVDLAFGWKRRSPRRLEAYRASFPELFRDSRSVQVIAEKEYRLRLSAGECPSPSDYQRAYGVVTVGWPAPAAAVRRGAAAPRPDEYADGPLEAATSYQEIRLQNVNDSDSWKDSFRGSPDHAGLFLEMQRSDPETAERLVQAVTALPEVGTEFLGFRLQQELGKGAFARVYLCQQGELANRFVVLKISPHLDTELQTLAQLQHTNVVPIYSVHRAGALQAVCMPFFGSTTLANVLKNLEGREALPESGKGLISTLADRKSATRPAAPPPAPAEVVANADSSAAGEVPAGSTAILEMLEGLSYVEAILWMMARLADGLAHAHERGVIHRDLKPANILLTDEGQPMLLDFNLAQDTKFLANASAALVGGTLPFMAPEQLEAYRTGKNCIDRRSDIYALGVILAELLTGRHPFPVRTGPLQQVLFSMIADRLQPPPRVRPLNKAVSPAVESIVRHCLEPDPARRYQSARELQEDLERQLTNQPLKHAPEASWRERFRKWLRRHPRLTSSTTVAAFAAVLTVSLTYSLMMHVHRLGKLEATAALAQFQDEMRSAQFYLTTRTADADQLAVGVNVAHAALGRYQAVDNPAWQDLPAVRRLSAEDQERLREDVGELLLLLAQARTVQAAGDQDPKRQNEQLQAALRLNERAEACVTTDRVPQAVLRQRAELARLLGRESEAKRLSDQAATVRLRTPTDHYLLATEHVARGRYRQAIPLLQEATQQDPQHYWAWFTLGTCHDNLAQDAEAVACYSASMGLRPRSPYAYFNRGLVHLRGQNYKQARADFDQAVQLQPDHADAHINRSLARLGLGDPQGAIEDLTRALDLGAPYTRVYFMRSRARERAGDREGARLDWEEGLRLEPKDEKSWLARGVARLAKEPEAALADFRKAVECSPRSLPALQNVAHALARLDRNEEAVKALDATLRHHPDYVPARIGRGVLLARLGRRDDAHRDAEDVLVRDNKAATLYQAACVYALTSRKETADQREAYRLLASALWKGYGLDLLDKDKDLEPIRQEAEFRRLADGARAFYASTRGQAQQPK